MKSEVKEFLTSLNRLNVILKRNSLMLEELNADWQTLFEDINKQQFSLKKLNHEKKDELLQKANYILSLSPTYSNENPTSLYNGFKKDIATYLNNSSLVKDETFEQLYLKQQILEFEYANYEKQRKQFSKTLKSIQVFRAVLNKGDEPQK